MDERPKRFKGTPLLVSTTARRVPAEPAYHPTSLPPYHLPGYQANQDIFGVHVKQYIPIGFRGLGRQAFTFCRDFLAFWLFRLRRAFGGLGSQRPDFAFYIHDYYPLNRIIIRSPR